MKLADKELGDVLGIVGLCVRAAGHAEAFKRIDAVERISQRSKDTSDGLLSCRERAHAIERDGANCAVVVQDGSALLQTTVDVESSGGHAPEKVVEEEHVERLGKHGARDAGPGIGGDFGMNDKDAEETAGAIVAGDGFKKLPKDAVLRAHFF